MGVSSCPVATPEETWTGPLGGAGLITGGDDVPKVLNSPVSGPEPVLPSPVSSAEGGGPSFPFIAMCCGMRIGAASGLSIMMGCACVVGVAACCGRLAGADGTGGAVNNMVSACFGNVAGGRNG